jgi:hypothetical protein
MKRINIMATIDDYNPVWNKIKKLIPEKYDLIREEVYNHTTQYTTVDPFYNSLVSLHQSIKNLVESGDIELITVDRCLLHFDFNK